jgi:hypothetical protein
VKPVGAFAPTSEGIGGNDRKFLLRATNLHVSPFRA